MCSAIDVGKAVRTCATEESEVAYTAVTDHGAWAASIKSEQRCRWPKVHNGCSSLVKP